MSSCYFTIKPQDEEKQEKRVKHVDDVVLD